MANVPSRSLYTQIANFVAGNRVDGRPNVQFLLPPSHGAHNYVGDVIDFGDTLPLTFLINYQAFGSTGSAYTTLVVESDDGVSWDDPGNTTFAPSTTTASELIAWTPTKRFAKYEASGGGAGASSVFLEAFIIIADS